MDIFSEAACDAFRSPTKLSAIAQQVMQQVMQYLLAPLYAWVQLVGGVVVVVCFVCCDLEVCITVGG